MKKLFIGLLALGAVACQQATTSNHVPTTDARSAATAAPVAPAADSTAAVLALTRQVNLAPAWQGSREAAMDGFYGPDNYRISFHLDSVWCDAAQPNVYQFRGRDRYKRVITPFTGTLTVTRLAPLPDTIGLEHSFGDRAYTAFTSFVLHEDPAAKGAGHCTGRAVLDFQVDDHNRAKDASFDGIDLGGGNPSKGCAQIFRGIWQDNRTGRKQPVAWANYYGVIVPDVLSEMGLGSRGDDVDPRLARYGWNTIYENDEWWADSPKPKLSL